MIELSHACALDVEIENSSLKVIKLFEKPCKKSTFWFWDAFTPMMHFEVQIFKETLIFQDSHTILHIW